MSDPDPAEDTPSPEERNWALGAHLGPLLLALLGVGILSWVVPLWIYFTRRDSSEYVADQARESLNFRISVAVAYALSMALIPIAIGILLYILVWLADLIFTTMASIKANDGVRFRYPLALRLIP